MVNCLHECMSGMQGCQPPMQFLPMLIVWILIIALQIQVIRWAALWFVFQKAGEPGWAAIIPIYNILIAIKVAGKPWWYILMLLIPIVNIVIGIMILNGISKNFGKGGWFTVGLVFFRTIFMAILGFGKSQYSGDKSKFDA